MCACRRRLIAECSHKRGTSQELMVMQKLTWHPLCPHLHPLLRAGAAEHRSWQPPALGPASTVPGAA